jgi:hypothetical protein
MPVLQNTHDGNDRDIAQKRAAKAVGIAEKREIGRGIKC